MLFRSDLWEAVASGITAENQKIEIFIHHNLSRGTAREALLRSIMVQHTPDPFKVRSGFVYTDNHTVAPSKQCDVLVYNPFIRQPYYQLDEFVVVSRDSATLIAEVKSEINDGEFTKLREMTAYANGIPKPLMSFIYGGWIFDTFCQKCRPFAANLTASLPTSIVVHERNYLAICPTAYGTPVFFLIEFPKSHPGMATAYFLSFYEALIRNNPLKIDDLWDWVTNRLTIVPPQGKRWLTVDGEIHQQGAAAPSPAG